MERRASLVEASSTTSLLAFFFSISFLYLCSEFDLVMVLIGNPPPNLDLVFYLTLINF